ncbi:O-acetylserine/cysteine exporter [Rhodoferax lacus]|uniref:O-acetylserine/cysteine exporter n=1 Tax=Rhodoferax lacus TaxID=2184758 RepID=A0A3E1RBD6_9BURK|nr:EamA family transporter [Rhodoferax lacus]RFO96668.1 O-acetylserine/cysteine exporter [Rhodoferax lacus]
MSDSHAFSRLDYFKALTVVVIWGLNFVAMKVALPGLGPMLLGALRFAAASLPFVLWVRRPNVPWRFIVLYGLLQGVGQFGLLFTGLALGMTAGMASVVLQAQAFFTMLLAVPLLGERARGYQWLGLLLAAGGLVVLASSHGSLPGQMTLIGFFFSLGAALMWASANLAVRFMGRQSASYDPFAFIVWSSLVPILPFLAMACALDGVQPVLQAVLHLSLREFLAILFLALLATLLAYTLWTGLLKRFPVGRVAPFSLLVPVVGLLSAYVAFDEQLSLLQVLGTVGVLLGLLVNQLGGRFLRLVF